MTLQPGTRLGHYEITSLLGSGGMGEVYRAKDHKLGRDVAIKVLREELASDPERLRRFEQEARSASALNHPNIITIHDIRLRHLSAEGYGGQVGKTEDVDFIVMEFVEGKTLREMLSEGPLPTKKLLQIATQIAEGLAKAHTAGIVHRDLKPENLMVTSDGYVKILDFGLAKLRTSRPDADSDVATMTKEGTAQGTVMGTVGYMSPEQAKGQPADYRSDQFSLGAILYEMATGRRAFQRDSSVQTLSAIIEQEPASIAALNPETPPHLRFAVERCLEKNPEDRYDSTRDLARELKNIREIDTPLTSEPTTAPLQKRRKWPRIVAITGGIVAVLSLALTLNVGGFRDRLTGELDRPPLDSIAVLPLENLSGDPEQEYFADGMTDELIAELAKISALKVISRTSVMQYKGARKPLPEIARELNVDAIVEGTVRRAEDRVRITAQLIEAATDQNLWAESFERELHDVLTLQSEVARAIAREIRVKLTPQEKAQLVATHSVDPEAYDAYLKGRFHLYVGNATGFKRAIEYFDEAIEKYPDFALAYAGRADTYANLELWGALPPGEGLLKAREAAQKALEIDETLAEAYASLGYVKLMFEWDWPGAERQFKRALELNPNSVVARERYSNFLSSMNRHDEAIAEIEAARRLDPLNPWYAFRVGITYYLARRYERAIAHFQEALEMVPNMANAYFFLAQTFTAKNALDEATIAAKKAVSLSSREAWTLAQLGLIYGLSGNRALAQDILAELKEKGSQQHVPAQALARVYMGIGETDQAFEWLEKAYEERVWLHHNKVLPLWDPLRSDPRFQDLLRRMNFPE